jgi:hypothetical protein
LPEKEDHDLYCLIKGRVVSLQSREKRRVQHKKLSTTMNRKVKASPLLITDLHGEVNSIFFK